MSVSFKGGLFIPAILLLFATSATSTTAQTVDNNGQVANATLKPKTSTTNAEAGPLLSDYRGVKIGMPLKDARASVDRYLKSKGDRQDILVFSDTESAQIYYDAAGKVMAISVDYFVKNGNAPSPTDVLGMNVSAKPDGSMYAMKRYPAAGYWVSYNRTAGESPIVTITMQAFK